MAPATLHGMTEGKHDDLFAYWAVDGSQQQAGANPEILLHDMIVQDVALVGHPDLRTFWNHVDIYHAKNSLCGTKVFSCRPFNR